MVQAHGEILQAIALRHTWDQFELRQHPSQALQPIGMSLSDASRAFSGQRLGQLVQTNVPDEVARKSIIEFVRASTQLNRNWGYSYQIFRVARELFAPLGKYMKEACGATADELLDFWISLTKLVELRLNFVIETLGKRGTDHSPDPMVRRVGRSFGLSGSEIESLRETVRRSAKGPDADAATWFLCLDRLLPMVHLLSWSNMRKACPDSVSDDILQALVSRWSLSFGELAGTKIEHYFLDNPVWARPLICLGNQTWHLPFPGLFFSFCWDLLGDVLKVDHQAYDRYLKRRAAYLENAIADEFRRAFPMAIVIVGNEWIEPRSGIRYENDVLVRIDSIVIVIEAKSGMIHPTARRGGAARLERAIKDLLVDPAVQSFRLEEYLRTQHESISFDGADGHGRKFDMRGVETVLSWSITLDDVADLSAVRPQLVASGWIPSDVSLPPSMSFSDLQNIFALLDGYCSKLHYLCRRAQWVRSAKYTGDELDLLAVYFDTLFEIGKAESDGTRLMTYGASRIFERYFLELEQGRRPRKPKLPMTRWWFNILAVLEERLPTRWSQIGLDLLSVPEYQQEHFAELMREVRQNVLQGVEPLKDSVVFVSEANRKVAIVGVAYMDASREERNERLTNAASRAQFSDGSRPSRVVVIGCDPRIQGVPYSTLALVGFDSDPAADQKE